MPSQTFSGQTALSKRTTNGIKLDRLATARMAFEEASTVVDLAIDLCASD